MFDVHLLNVMLDLKFKIDLSELERLMRKYPQISKDVRVEKLTEAVMLLEREVKKNTPHGAGPIHLRDSIHGKVRVAGKKVIGVVGTPMEHGEPVESGTKPHFPPTGPIQHWVERKLGIHGKEAASVAFLIARAISKRGTEGAHMFEDAFEDNESKLKRILGEIPGEIVRRTEAL